MGLSNFEANNARRSPVVLLIFVLLTLPLGGAVSHYCFDGMEPPVTIHFDNLKGHVEHGEENGHVDMERQLLADNLLVKLFDFQALLGFVAVFLFTLLVKLGNGNYFLLAPKQSCGERYYLPPLRAPPLYS